MNKLSPIGPMACMKGGKYGGSGAHRLDVILQALEQGAQGPDHPIHPAIPETEYLKAVFAIRL